MKVVIISPCQSHGLILLLVQEFDY